MNRKINLAACQAIPLEEADVYAAMQEFGAYLDITPADFQAVYAYVFAIAQRRLLQAITAQDIMSSPALTLASHLSLQQAVAFLNDHNISGAPVLNEQGRLMGVLSETDIARAIGDTGTPTPMSLLQALMQKSCLGLETTMDMPVDTFMSTSLITIRPASTLSEMLALMQAHRINRLPVLDGDQLIGIVSRTDMLNAFGVMP